MNVTFDSNVWEKVIDEADHHYVQIKNKIRTSEIRPHICQIALSLEAIEKKWRAEFFKPTLRTYFGGLQDLLKSCKPAWVLSLLIFDNPIRAWIRFELRPKTVFFGRLNGRKASIHGVRNTEYMNC